MSENPPQLKYDALLLLSFGGPEGPDDVIPFLENVLRGRNVPRERMLEVAEHYYHFGGKSPINDQNKELLGLLKAELGVRGHDLPVYWGNRNWKPYLSDTLRQMHDDGRQHGLIYVTSAYSSYSGCRQYREDLKRAKEELGESCPAYTKLRPFFNHPTWVAVNAERVKEARARLNAGDANTPLVFTAHSIPESMSASCDYLDQLKETCRLVAEAAGQTTWHLVFQSRSGPPQQAWLEPDICDFLEMLHGEGVEKLIISPIGFTSDHLEVLYDLDDEAREKSEKLGMRMERAGTAGNHPLMVSMICDLIDEQLSGNVEPACCGKLPARPSTCAQGCCPPPAARPH